MPRIKVNHHWQLLAKLVPFYFLYMGAVAIRIDNADKRYPGEPQS
jgi:hypothetical protein